MEKNTRMVELEGDDGNKIPFFVMEETKLAGVNYLLVSEDESEEAVGYILREVSEEEQEKVYEMVDDEKELEALSKVFEELLDDVDIEI